MFRRAFSTSSPRSSLAKMTLIGRLGNTLAPQTSEKGTEYLRYSLAVTTGSGEKTHTSWFNVAVFDPNSIQYMTSNVRKGALLYVEANASMQSYEDPTTGKKLSSLQLYQKTCQTLKNGAEVLEE